MKKQFSYYLERKMWTVLIKIRLHILCSLNLDLQCPKRLLVSSSVTKELIGAIDSLTLYVKDIPECCSLIFYQSYH